MECDLCYGWLYQKPFDSDTWSTYNFKWTKRRTRWSWGYKKTDWENKGVFKVICKKIEELDYSSDDYVELIKAIKFYLENYDFYNVIEAYKMYDEDSARIRNMRTLVIRALEEKDLIEKIKQVMKRQD